MRKVIFAFVLLCYVSCSDESISPEEEAQRAAIARMEQNAKVIDEAFLGTIEVLEKIDPAELTAMLQSSTRDAFIKYMLQATNSVFDNAIEKSREEMGWDEPETYTAGLRPVGSYILKEYLDAIPHGIDGPSPGTGVIDKFAAAIEAEIARQGSGDQIHIESFSWGLNQTGAHSTGQSRPTTYGDLSVMISLEKVIEMHEDEDALDEAMDQFVIENQQQMAVLMAMLIPAVQTIRETNRSGQTINNMRQLGIAALNGTDIIGYTRTEWAQQLRRVALLAGIYAILHPEFQPTDADYASITPQRTMYEAVTVLIWAAYYDQPK